MFETLVGNAEQDLAGVGRDADSRDTSEGFEGIKVKDACGRFEVGLVDEVGVALTPSGSGCE
ncbi:MAG: hypothetical protein K2K65_08660 [Duncaniella sp.]|nr:hypothetical protein [Duncaniella sp.]